MISNTELKLHELEVVRGGVHDVSPKPGVSQLTPSPYWAQIIQAIYCFTHICEVDPK